MSAANSICSAHSRAFRRPDVFPSFSNDMRKYLLVSPYTLLFCHFAIKVCNLDSRHGCFESLVVRPLAAAVRCLFHCVGRDDAKQDRNAGCHARSHNTARGFTRDVIEVRCITANYDAQCDDRIETPAFRSFQTCERKLECAGNLEYFNCLFGCTAISEGLESS